MPKASPDSAGSALISSTAISTAPPGKPLIMIFSTASPDGVASPGLSPVACSSPEQPETSRSKARDIKTSNRLLNIVPLRIACKMKKACRRNLKVLVQLRPAYFTSILLSLPTHALGESSVVTRRTGPFFSSPLKSAPLTS